MTEYKGFKYEKTAKGWKLILPSGAKLSVPEQPEDNLKSQIDRLIDG